MAIPARAPASKPAGNLCEDSIRSPLPMSAVRYEPRASTPGVLRRCCPQDSCRPPARKKTPGLPCAISRLCRMTILWRDWFGELWLRWTMPIAPVITAFFMRWLHPDSGALTHKRLCQQTLLPCERPALTSAEQFWCLRLTIFRRPLMLPVICESEAVLITGHNPFALIWYLCKWAAAGVLMRSQLLRWILPRQSKL